MLPAHTHASASGSLWDGAKSATPGSGRRHRRTSPVDDERDSRGGGSRRDRDSSRRSGGDRYRPKRRERSPAHNADD